MLPGSADRILAMAEREQNHRHKWEDKEQKVEARIAFSGQFLGFGALIALIGAAIYCAIIGATIIGASCLGTAAVGVISKFISHRWSRHEHGPQQSAAPERPPPQLEQQPSLPDNRDSMDPDRA